MIRNYFVAKKVLMIVKIQGLFQRLVVMPGLISLMSCASWKSAVPNENQKVISDKNYEILNGDYRAVSNEERSLAEILFNPKDTLARNIVTGLRCIDKNRISVTVREGDAILKERVIKGRIRDNYFITRRSTRVTFRFIINGVSSSKTRIGLLNNDILTVDTKISGIGFLVVVPGFASGGEVDGIQYERVK